MNPEDYQDYQKAIKEMMRECSMAQINESHDVSLNRNPFTNDDRSVIELGNASFHSLSYSNEYDFNKDSSDWTNLDSEKWREMILGSFRLDFVEEDKKEYLKECKKIESIFDIIILD